MVFFVREHSASEELPEERGGFPRAAFSYQIMSPMRGFMQAGYARIPRLGKCETTEGPDGIQLRLAIDEVFEIGRDVEVRGNGLERFRRKVADGHDVRGIDSIESRAISRQLHGNTSYAPSD
jgi:hypothetical protein